MFISTLVEEMDFVRSSNGDSRINGHIRDSDSDDSLMIVLEVFDFGL